MASQPRLSIAEAFLWSWTLEAHQAIRRCLECTMSIYMGVALSPRLIWRISRGVSRIVVYLIEDITYPYVKLSSLAINQLQVSGPVW
jgi:hypothetical protein